MPRIRYDAKYKVSSLPISTSDLVTRYLFGIPLVDGSGNTMSTEQVAFYINAAKEEIEGYLDLKLGKQIIEENIPYMRQEYLGWGYIPTSFPVLEAISLVGMIGTVEQVVYPPEWLSIKKSTDPTAMHRQIHLVPNGGTAAGSSSIIYVGISPHVGWFGAKQIPNYWSLKYCTSFERIPEDILDVVGKLASLNIFNILGDLILGQAGLAGSSLAVDGLSQSISTTLSATSAGFGSRVIQYKKELKEAMPLLKQKYKGIGLIAV